MTNLLHSPPTVGAQSLRALGRFPSRTAFSWPGGSITYRGAIDQIGRMQRVLLNAGAGPAARVALLSANRADAWCVGVAAQISRLATTWLHPLASLDDQIDQIEDCEAEDPGDRPRCVSATRRRTRGASRGRPPRFHARPRGIWRRSALRHGDRRQRFAEGSRRTGRRRRAQLHRRHDRQIQGGATPPSGTCGLRQRRVVEFRDSRQPPLSRGRADQPCRRHQGAADLDVRRHGAPRQGLRPRSRAGRDRSGTNKLHAARTDDDLRALGPSLAEQDRPVLARIAALRRLPDFA